MDRDFDMEKIIDKMRSLRDKRDLELLEKDIEGINLDSDYQRNLPNNKVLDVKYLGTIEWEAGTEKEIYLIIEQKQNEDGVLTEVERYYTEDGEFLGGNNKSDQFNYLILDTKYMNNEELLQKLQVLNKEGILDLNKIEQDRLEEIALSLGVKVEDLESIDEIELNQTIEDNKENKKNEESREIKEDELEGLNIKEETATNTYLKGETLAQKLKLPPDVVKLARVSASNLNEITGKQNNNIDAFVGIKNNGKAVEIGDDILRQDTSMGTNPTNQETTINNDGSVNKEVVTSSYLIVNGNGREYLQIGNDETSGKEIKYTQRSNTSNENVAVELNTQRTWPQNSNVRQYLNDKGAGREEVNDVLARDKAHGECKEKDVTVIDNDKNNDSHGSHVGTQDTELSDYVRQILDTPILDNQDDITIANFKGRDAVKNILLNAMQGNENENIEKVAERVAKNMKAELKEEAKETEMENQHEHGKN